ncbi:hypothetical protein [Sulfuricurvum sp. IAE1]|uniref:hypothetical protein n=1 Tax=Sulfuricurvum sp. IAE1 TaxID=2546102 RepID=UPI0014042E5E|nr:hypothetical protein [Sulfuricurvum sp. IAE1]
MKQIVIEVVARRKIDEREIPVLMKLTYKNKFGGTISRNIKGGWAEALTIASEDAVQNQ